MTILSVALLGLAVGATSIIRDNQANLYMTIATNLAQDKLEELKGQDLAGIATGGPSDVPVQGVPVVFARSWTVSLGGSNNCPAVADFKCIAVTVSWTYHTNRQVTVSSAVKT